MNQIAHYAVIGHPVAHSKSPQIHAEFARLTGQHMDYQRLLAPLDGFESTVQGFVAGGGRGLNVTLPFKQQAWAMLARLKLTKPKFRLIPVFCRFFLEVGG